jgi:hypothetical protein
MIVDIIFTWIIRLRLLVLPVDNERGDFMKMLDWHGIKTIYPNRYTCGHCGTAISSEKGYTATTANTSPVESHYILICHSCTLPTYTNLKDVQIPGAPYGRDIKHITNADVVELYKEAKQCMSVGAYTGSIMCSRKLLMNIAVGHGAKENKSFVEYVDFLAENNWVPPNGREWLEHIRKKGNEANHEIHIMSRTDAEDLLGFLEMLLIFMYEFPERMAQKAAIS